MAEAATQGKDTTDEYAAAFELIQKFGITAEQLETAQKALEAILD